MRTVCTPCHEHTGAKMKVKVHTKIIKLKKCAHNVKQNGNLCTLDFKFAQKNSTKFSNVKNCCAFFIFFYNCVLFEHILNIL